MYDLLYDYGVSTFLKTENYSILLSLWIIVFASRPYICVVRFTFYGSKVVLHFAIVNKSLLSIQMYRLKHVVMTIYLLTLLAWFIFALHFSIMTAFICWPLVNTNRVMPSLASVANLSADLLQKHSTYFRMSVLAWLSLIRIKGGW